MQVWHKAHALTLEVYRVSGEFPREEMFGLTSQVCRASSSIPANIAEGCGRGSDGEFGRFLQIAMGSASELEYHLLLARDLGYLDGETHTSLETRVTENKRMLTGLIQSLNTGR
ncbi:MAG: four helix bundle protein [Aggregatilineaceae bacterium]